MGIDTGDSPSSCLIGKKTDSEAVDISDQISQNSFNKRTSNSTIDIVNKIKHSKLHFTILESLDLDKIVHAVREEYFLLNQPLAAASLASSKIIVIFPP